MKFFVLTFSDGTVVSDTFDGVFSASCYACEYCVKHGCTLKEMLGMQSIEEYMKEV